MLDLGPTNPRSQRTNVKEYPQPSNHSLQPAPQGPNPQQRENEFDSFLLYYSCSPNITPMKVKKLVLAHRIWFYGFEMWPSRFKGARTQKLSKVAKLVEILYFLSVATTNLYDDCIPNPKIYSGLQKNSFFWPFMKRNGVYSNWNKVS